MTDERGWRYAEQVLRLEAENLRKRGSRKGKRMEPTAYVLSRQQWTTLSDAAVDANGLPRRWERAGKRRVIDIDGGKDND